MHDGWTSLVVWLSESSAVLAVKRHRHRCLSHLEIIWPGTQFPLKLVPSHHLEFSRKRQDSFVGLSFLIRKERAL